MVTLFLVICSLLVAREAAAVGLGEQTIYREGAMLDTDFDQPARPNLIFFQDISGNPIEADDDKFVELIKKLNVNVVAPSKDLAKMMNVASTKSRASFLKYYERYFKGLDVGSVSRPMLLSYLGLEFTEQEELNSWYAPQKSRISDKVVRSCKALLAERIELHTNNAETENQLRKLIHGDQAQMDGDQSQKLHHAYLIFQNNLNLFMLENYLLLCSRLEPEKLSVELDESGFLFRKHAS